MSLRKVLWNVELINNTDRRDNAVERFRAVTAEEAGQIGIRQYNGTGWGWSLGRVWRVRKPAKKSLESQVNKKMKSLGKAIENLQIKPRKAVPVEPFDAVLEAARKDLGWETMKDRGIDRLDFHEVSVFRMRKLLKMAYESGLNDMREGRV